MDRLTGEVRKEYSWFMFVDGVVICSEAKERVEEHLGTVEVCSGKDMKVGCSRTKYLCVN